MSGHLVRIVPAISNQEYAELVAEKMGWKHHGDEDEVDHYWYDEKDTFTGFDTFDFDPAADGESAVEWIKWLLKQKDTYLGFQPHGRCVLQLHGIVYVGVNPDPLLALKAASEQYFQRGEKQ